jgi:hypothetical protein
MAVNRVLTNEEKQILQSSVRFNNECDWAIRNFSSFWSSTDGTVISSQIGNVGYQAWFKNHIFSVGTMISGIDDPNITMTFCVLAKGMNLWDNSISPFNVDTVINYMILNSKFEELSTMYVSLKTQSIIF